MPFLGMRFARDCSRAVVVSCACSWNVAPVRHRTVRGTCLVMVCNESGRERKIQYISEVRYAYSEGRGLRAIGSREGAPQKRSKGLDTGILRKHCITHSVS